LILMYMLRWSLTIGFALLLLAGAGPAGAGDTPASDWPGLWGPHRDARVAGPLRAEPGMQLVEAWRRPLGKGYSEVAATAGRGYTMYSDGEVDHLLAFEVASGKEVWRARMAATYRGHGSDDGPISTPVIADGRVFALDPWGVLFAFDAAAGRELWRRDLKADLGAVPPFWGFATSPLPLGKTLVVQAGGAERNNLVALDPATGKTLWASQPAKENGYSSPVSLTLAGTPQVVAATNDKIFGVKPEDGTVLWTLPGIGEPRQSPMPLPGDRLLVMSPDIAALLQVTHKDGVWQAVEVWKKPVFKGTYSPVVFHQGHLFGMNGMYLACVDPVTAEVKWREKIYSASLILVGDYLAVVGERSGSFQLVAATPEGFREALRIPVFTPGARTLTGPMFVDGGFLLRNGEEMVMLRLAPAARQAGAKP